MSNENKLRELYPETEFVFLRGFDSAIMGTAISKGNIVVCYSVPKMVDALMKDHDMVEQEAEEWLEFNTLFAYFGDETPVFFEGELT